MRPSALIAALVMIFMASIATAAPKPVPKPLKPDPCLICHADKTPSIVAHWKESKHAGAEVQCAACHGSDVKAAHEGQARVMASKCGQCHRREYEEHGRSRHALGTKTGQGCTRNLPESRERQRTCSHCHEPGSTKPIVNSECAMFLAQSPEMQRQGCSSCHRVEDRCDTCHMKHSTDRTVARSAEVCGACHMGPDHAQLEMWRTSQHGALYALKGEPYAPTCATCHMPGGSHDVSRGIATGQPAPEHEAQRKYMIKLCARCHTEALAERSLADADAIENQSRALLAEGEEIVRLLGKEGLLMPAPEARSPHPLFGASLVLGPHMLYEDLSGPEALLFRMKLFYYMSAYKGAFHQNPDYAHWYGNAPLKLAMSELKSMKETLLRMKGLEGRVDNLAGWMRTPSPQGPQSTPLTGETLDSLKRELRELRERYLKKEITEPAYERERKRLLDRHGL